MMKILKIMMMITLQCTTLLWSIEAIVTRDYELFLNKLSWTSARSDCLSRKGRIATVDSADNNNFLKDLIENQLPSADNAVWIGLNDRARERGTSRNDWVWDFGDTFSFQDFASSEPTGRSGEDCIAMAERPGFQWRDRNCDDKNAYVCEFDVVTVAPTTKSPTTLTPTTLTPTTLTPTNTEAILTLAPTLPIVENGGNIDNDDEEGEKNEVNDVAIGAGLGVVLLSGLAVFVYRQVRKKDYGPPTVRYNLGGTNHQGRLMKKSPVTIEETITQSFSHPSDDLGISVFSDAGLVTSGSFSSPPPMPRNSIANLDILDNTPLEGGVYRSPKLTKPTIDF